MDDGRLFVRQTWKSGKHTKHRQVGGSADASKTQKHRQVEGS
jgi:hypothetical protein